MRKACSAKLFGEGNGEIVGKAQHGIPVAMQPLGRFREEGAFGSVPRKTRRKVLPNQYGTISHPSPRTIYDMDRASNTVFRDLYSVLECTYESLSVICKHSTTIRPGGFLAGCRRQTTPKRTTDELPHIAARHGSMLDTMQGSSLLSSAGTMSPVCLPVPLSAQTSLLLGKRSRRSRQDPKQTPSHRRGEVR